MNWQTGQSIFAVGMMVMAAWTVGRLALRRMKVLSDDPFGQGLWAVGVGSILWGMGLAGLGLLGLLYVPIVGGLTWCVCLVGFWKLLQSMAGGPNPGWGHSLFPQAVQWLDGNLPERAETASGKTPASLPTGKPGSSSGIDPGGADSSFAQKAEEPLPYEHAPPPDLVSPGGLPVSTPEWAPLAARPEPQTNTGDWEPVLADPEGNNFGPWLGGEPNRRRLDPPSSLFLGGNRSPGAGARPPGWLEYLVWSLTAGGVLAALVVALAPPTAGDALCYHLELPKRFLQSHRLIYLPYDDTCTYPLLMEMWFLWALVLDGEVAAQLTPWVWGLMLAGAAIWMARLWVDRAWAWLAGAVVLLTPGVLNQMTAPLNDAALAAMTTLGLAAWFRACVVSQFPKERKEWFLLAGLALGGAAGIKYTFILILPLLAALWVFCYQTQPAARRILLQGVLLAGGVVVSVAGLWYLRAAWYRGNPVFPFAQSVWPSRVPPPESDWASAEKSPWAGQGLAGLVAPWSLTMHPERFGGRGHQIGVIWLAVLPGLLWTQRHRRLELLLVLAGGYFFLWAVVRPNVRFLLPILPMLAPGVVWVWMQMRRLPGWPRLVAAGAIALALFVPVGWLGLRMEDHLAVAVGLETRQEFLYRKEPSYPAAVLANLLLPAEAKILSQDYRSFYFDPVVVRESVYRRLSRYDQKVHQPGDLARLLREEGFTHLLLVENISGTGIQFDPTLARLAEAELALPQSPLQELSEYRMVDADGVLRRYRLLAIR